MRRRLLLASGLKPNDPLTGFLVILVNVLDVATGICVAKVCVALLGFKPSLAVVGNVPSALKFKADAKTIALGCKEEL